LKYATRPTTKFFILNEVKDLEDSTK